MAGSRGRRAAERRTQALARQPVERLLVIVERGGNALDLVDGQRVGSGAALDLGKALVVRLTELLESPEKIVKRLGDLGRAGSGFRRDGRCMGHGRFPR